MKPPLPFFKTGQSRVLTLELQSKTRDCWALSYAYLLSLHYDVTGSIELQFSSAKVVIEGQQLKSLYDALIGTNCGLDSGGRFGERAVQRRRDVHSIHFCKPHGLRSL